MAVLQKLLQVLVGMIKAVGKLLYLSLKLILSLFLLVVQMILTIFHAGSSR